MLNIIQTVTSQYTGQSLYELLQNVPDMSWTPRSEPHPFKTQPPAKMATETLSAFEPFESDVEAPAQWNWLTESPYCFGVTNQDNCEANWAFAATQTLSDCRCVNRFDRQRVAYSEQYLISCDAHNMGCKSGSGEAAANYLIGHGLPTAKCVSYESGQSGEAGKCPTACDDQSAMSFTKAKKVQKIKQNESQIETALQSGPLLVQFQVFEDFLLYDNGIYQHKTGAVQGNMAAEIVGYGISSEGAYQGPYWVVKVSWGLSFGEKGYFRIVKGINECKIEESVMYIQA